MQVGSAAATPSVMTKRDDDAEASRKEAPPDASKEKRTGRPPPMAARIADVEPFVAPFEPPPGALKPPPQQPPVWRSQGNKTGQLTAASAPLPKTVELPLPDAPAMPQTVELEAPSGASGLFAETTSILNDAQLRGEEAVPLRAKPITPFASDDDEERTDQYAIPPEFLASDVDTVGDSPSPLDGDDTGPHAALLIFEETTAILPDRVPPPEDDEG